MPTDAETDLTGVEAGAWRAFFGATTRLFEEMDRRLQAEAGIGLADFVVLARLDDAGEGGLRMGELADNAAFSRSRISHAVSRLEELGWVERRHCPTDRRGAYAALTETGRAKLVEAAPGHAEVLRRHLIGNLSADEVAVLTKVMDRVRDSLQGECVAATAP